MAEWIDFSSFHLFQNVTLDRVDDVWGDLETVENASKAVENKTFFVHNIKNVRFRNAIFLKYVSIVLFFSFSFRKSSRPMIAW